MTRQGISHSLKGLRVLVAGGTGFIGRALCRHLSEQGAIISIVSRSPQAAQRRVPQAEAIYTTCRDIPAETVFEAIINLTGETVAQRWTPQAMTRIRDSRIETTNDILDYIGRAETRPRVLVSGSAIGYYGTHPKTEFSEDTEPSMTETGMFSRCLCMQWEAAALAARDMGVRTVLLRTGIVLEKDGGTLEKLYPPFIMGAGGPIGNGRQWMSWIHRDDLVGLIELALVDETLEGPVNATAPHPVSNACFARALGRALHRPAFMPTPGFVLKAVFGQMADELMLNGQKVLPAKALQHGYHFKYPDLPKALKAIYHRN